MPVDTKSIIAEKFALLAMQKDIDKITIKELVDACGISRQTFYYHFLDILDVIEWSTERIAEQMLTRCQNADNAQEALKLFISSVFEGHAIIQKLLRSQKREQIERLLIQTIRKYLTEAFRIKLPNLQLNYSDLEATLTFYSYGIVGLLIDACSQKQPDIDQLAHQMYMLLSGQMPGSSLSQL